jgi:type III pantothenate kinase
MSDTKQNNDFSASSRLIIDFGNTLTKVAIFEKSSLTDLTTSSSISIDQLEALKNKYSPRYAIISSVIDVPGIILTYLEKTFVFIKLDDHTPIPVINLYKTPETLGKDRLAMVVAAHHLFPGRNCLVIGAGTCITYDFINKSSNYFGGAISPGLSLRFKALHNFTSKLPLVTFKENVEITGTTTEESILSGVCIGTTAEIDGVINEYKALYDDLQVIFTGGDMKYFSKTLKNRIFAAANLVLTGLNVILDFNVNHYQESITS